MKRSAFFSSHSQTMSTGGGGVDEEEEEERRSYQTFQLNQRVMMSHSGGKKGKINNRTVERIKRAKIEQ